MRKLLVVIPLVFLLCFSFGCQKGEKVAEEAMVVLEGFKAQAEVEEDAS